MAQPVQVLGGRAGPDVWLDEFEHGRGRAPGGAHQVLLFGGLDGDGH
jgi:hypothetical protein